MKDDFSIKLRSLRKSRRKTQEDISKMLKITRSCYGEYERGNVKPPMHKLKFLANYFEVSSDYLIGTNEIEVIEKKIDISEILSNIINEINLENSKVVFEGDEISLDFKKLALINLQNTLENMKMIMKMHESEQKRTHKMP